VPRAVDENDQHCPFLNRVDERCSPHFHVDHLEHAFEHCFGRYKMCRHYLELLVERRVRRLVASAAAAAAASHPNHPGAGTDGTDADADADDADRNQPAAAPGRPPRAPGVLVQLRVRRGHVALGAPAVAA
jgi:hypothetical protein